MYFISSKVYLLFYLVLFVSQEICVLYFLDSFSHKNVDCGFAKNIFTLLTCLGYLLAISSVSIYIIRNVPVILFILHLASQKYQQNISLGIGQMLVLLWITYILGFKLLHESKLAKILKWSQASDFRFLSTDFLRIFVAITHFHFPKVYIYFAKRKVWSDNLKAIYINLYRVWIIVLHFKESFRDLQSIKI